MKFHATINKAKKNQPSSWAKTKMGIAENKGRSWKKDKEDIVKSVDEVDKHCQNSVL